MQKNSKKKVKLYDKEFVSFISNDEIVHSIKELASKMQEELVGEEIVALCVLNGCFMFAGELFKHFEIPCTVSFVKLASYEGTESTGNVKQIMGLNEQIKGKTVIIVEDIVDSGETIVKLVELLKAQNPKQIKVATMLLKPEAYKKDIHIDYVALTIPNKFVVGHGLDYDGLGRNLKDIYQIITN
ncbi:MAG: hypoxanthine phosphoribosyltransferase [Bacteroidales bacterium]|nr:hypoxanthine phosphoribosyltransferase [Bacteroidales bacterium]